MDINTTRNTASFSNISKNTSTFTGQQRHGKEPLVGDMENLTFNDPLYPGGDARKNLTFQELQDQTWTLQNKS